MPQFDFHLYKSSVFLILLSIFFFIFGNFVFPLYGKLTVKIIEDLQSFFLLFMCLYTYRYAKQVKQHDTALYKFWIWTIFWWFMLFGRGISWGRDFFPDIPRFYFKIIAIMVIAPPFLGMLFPSIRQGIKKYYQQGKIPFWHILLAFIFLGITDIAEHKRIGYELLVSTKSRQDMIEELMEFPCLFSLALTTRYMQKNEQLRLHLKC